MSETSLEHIITAVLVALPATIAAISSLKNGVEQKRVRKELAKTNGHLLAGVDAKKKQRNGDFQRDRHDPGVVSDPDWYKAPEFY
jgi:hypothetical protein